LLQNLLKVQAITFEPGLSVADIRANKNPAEAFAYKATRPFPAVCDLSRTTVDD
jgi:hypothetical protein